MASVVITISEEVKAELKRFSWINWSELARQEALKKSETEEKLKELKKLLAKSKFTEKDADELAEKVKLSMAKKLKAKGLV